MNILLVFDDKKRASKLKKVIGKDHKVKLTSFRKALKTLEEHFSDALIIDLDSEDFLPTIKAIKTGPSGKKLPCIVYTNQANAGYLDFSLGFDDFIISPVDAKELELRLQQVASKHKKIGKNQIKTGDLIVDIKTYEVTLKGKYLDLTFKEYELLRHFVSHRGQVFSRQILLETIWGYDYFGGTRTVDTHVARLRSKLGFKYGKLIETVQNVGYKFKK